MPLANEQDARFVVINRRGYLFALVPGSSETSLGISAPPSRRGLARFASDQPLMSPDGQTLAHLADGELRITDIRSRSSNPVEGLTGPVLIGPWSPDGHALLTASADGDWRTRDWDVHVVDVATLRATSIRTEVLLQWGNDASELIGYYPFDGSTGVARIVLPALEVVQVPGIAWKPAWTIADVRANQIVGRRPGYLWIYSDDASTAEPPIRRDLVAVPDFFLTDVRLAPDGRHIALCIEDPELKELDVLGSLTVVPIMGGSSKSLTVCRTSSRFYWYDNEQLVIGRLGVVDLVGLGGQVTTLAEDASLVAQLRHEERQ
jgi:hypothetical protein